VQPYPRWPPASRRQDQHPATHGRGQCPLPYLLLVPLPRLVASRIVWEARERRGRGRLGDFDVLDAMDEMFEAARRSACAPTWRSRPAFSPEFPDWEFSSPGEPGILYFMAPASRGCPAGHARRRLLDACEPARGHANEEMLERSAPSSPDRGGLRADVLPLTLPATHRAAHARRADTRPRDVPRRQPACGLLVRAKLAWHGGAGRLLGDTAKFRTASRRS